MRDGRTGPVVAAGTLLALVGAFVVVATLSYKSSRQYRRVPDSGPSSAALPAGASLASPGHWAPSRCSIYECQSAVAHPGPYSLAFVEFDDQGFLWDPRQMTTLRDHVAAGGEGRGVILVVFVHGWNHTA